MPRSNGTPPKHTAAPTSNGSHAGGADSGSGRVIEIQRARMLAAMAEVASEHGAANVTVAHVVARSGVSRRTFYEAFQDREDCFLAVFDEAAARACRRVSEAYDPQAKWAQRIRAALVALLAYLDEEPAMARVLIVESLGAGGKALARRGELLAHAIEALDRGRAEATRASAGPPPLAAEGIAGAIGSVLHARLLADSSEPLLGLVNQLMSIAVLPYQGAAAARRELDRPLPSNPSAPPTAHDQLRQLHMRLTYRTVRVLAAIAANPGSSNRRVSALAEVGDQGQMSKLLARLHNLGLIENAATDNTIRGEANAWTLTTTGWEIQSALAAPGHRSVTDDG